MRASECINIDLQSDERVALLLEDYAFFAEDPELFCNRLQTLVPALGKAVIEEWQYMVRSGQTDQVVKDLLVKHYDPTYARSVERNFVCWPQAQHLSLKDRHALTFKALATQLMAAENHIPA
jgi:tRNA 2-selenouridine synthase